MGNPSITDDEGAPNVMSNPNPRTKRFYHDQASWRRRTPKNESGRNFMWDVILPEPSTVFVSLCLCHAPLPPLPKACLSPQTQIRLPYLFISVCFLHVASLLEATAAFLMFLNTFHHSINPHPSAFPDTCRGRNNRTGPLFSPHHRNTQGPFIPSATSRQGHAASFPALPTS